MASSTTYNLSVYLLFQLISQAEILSPSASRLNCLSQIFFLKLQIFVYIMKYYTESAEKKGWYLVELLLVVLNKGSDEFRACKACKKIAWADFIAVFR